MKLFFASLLLLILQASAFQSSCEERSKLKDTILHKNTVYGNSIYERCWRILNPSKLPIILRGYLKFESYDCSIVNISVTVNMKTYTLCDSGYYKNDVISGNTDVLVSYRAAYQRIRDNLKLSLQLSYDIGFHNFQHIPKVRETSLRLISWLNNTRTSSWGWRENTARAIVALYLSDVATFNGTKLDEELMAKQLEIETATSLLRQPISNERLSMYINALLVSCNNPRRFYGQNLIRLLKEQVTSNENFTHPIAYLTLCNANETWPPKASEDLSTILNSDYKYPFIKDFQAIAVMALSCYRNSNNSFDEFENGSLKLDYERNVKEIAGHQLSDGSFGNIHSTALIAHALISNVAENVTIWNFNATLEYLIKELNSSSVDLTSVMVSLPFLNGKSFVDITKVNCSHSKRRHNDDDLVSDINDYLGPKMRIKYSLFIGEDKNIVHSIYLKVPENMTAYDIMQLAEVENPKYKFELKRINEDIYIYRIGSLTNDPEDGTFWLQYKKSRHDSHPRSYAQTAPNHLVLEDDDHLIMWYRKPSL